MTTKRPAEPWASFLDELDRNLDSPADFHCIGGFAVSQMYGFARETSDLDVLHVFPEQLEATVAEIAGRGSALHSKYRIYVDQVRVANYPADYELRLIRAFPAWSRIRLWVLEPHDLALTKLERSIERDIRDVIFLAQAGLIQRDTLIQRFQQEFEPYIVGPTPTWHRTTLQMWIDSCWPES